MGAPAISTGGAKTGKDLLVNQTMTSATAIELALTDAYSAYEFLVIGSGGAAIALSNDGGATYEDSSAYETHLSKLDSGGTSYSAAANTAYNGMFMANGTVTNQACIASGILAHHAKSGTKTMFIGSGIQLSTSNDFDGGTTVSTRNVAEVNDFVRIGKTHTQSLNVGDIVMVWGIK